MEFTFVTIVFHPQLYVTYCSSSYSLVVENSSIWVQAKQKRKARSVSFNLKGTKHKHTINNRNAWRGSLLALHHLSNCALIIKLPLWFVFNCNLRTSTLHHPALLILCHFCIRVINSQLFTNSLNSLSRNGRFNSAVKAKRFRAATTCRNT
jgi:hypothetical protein